MTKIIYQIDANHFNNKLSLLLLHYKIKVL